MNVWLSFIRNNRPLGKGGAGVLAALLLASCDFQPIEAFPPQNSPQGLNSLSVPALVFTALEPNMPGEEWGTWRGIMEVKTRSGDVDAPTGEVVQKSVVHLAYRGQTSYYHPKKSYAVELRSDSAPLNPENMPLLGLPEENDWVLHAGFLDRTLLRNVMAYKTSNLLGLWAPRTKFVEVWCPNLDDINISNPPTAYQGAYVLVEKVKRDVHRVNIEPLTPLDQSEEDLSGGYIFRIDKFGEKDWYPSGIKTYGLSVTEPNVTALTPAQKNWVTNWILDLEAKLDPASPGNWREMLDEQTFALYFLLQEWSRNVDGYRISTFMSKDRGGKLKAGPLWDFDLAFGNANYYGGDNPDDWPDDPSTTNKNESTLGWILLVELQPDFDDFHPAYWWRTLLRDQKFRRLLRNTWLDLRKGVLSDEHWQHTVNEEFKKIQPVLDRNYERWPTLGTPEGPSPHPLPGNANPDPSTYTYADHLAYLNQWVLQRMAWMDSPQAWDALEDFAKEPLP